MKYEPKYIIDQMGGKPSQPVYDIRGASPTVTRGRASIADIHAVLYLRDESRYEPHHSRGDGPMIMREVHPALATMIPPTLFQFGKKK